MRPFAPEVGEIIRPTSDIVRYFTFGEVVEDVPPIVPFEALCAPIGQEPDPVSLIDSDQVMTPERKQALGRIDLLLRFAAIKATTVSPNPDSWRVASKEGYPNHASCVEKAHQRMAALGIPRN